MVGEQLHQYRITERLGAGGMGVVWKAFDTRLMRDVALKVLAERVSVDRAGEERLLREARAASALNHPHIVTIYEIDSDKGRTFIAMEYVKGRNLGEILSERPVPLMEATEYLIQIAGALAKAHDTGIVHRDLKPENIMLTEDGQIKVLDFGIAKSILTAAVATSATITVPQTLPGVLVGTPAYMSPEQIVGEPVEATSDVFSFGILMHELLCHERPFRGANAADLFRCILSEEPILAVPGIPECLSSIISHCLQRTPRERYQTASEVFADLQRARATLTRVAPERPVFNSTATLPFRRLAADTRPTWKPIVAATAIGLLVTVGIYFGWHSSLHTSAAQYAGSVRPDGIPPAADRESQQTSFGFTESARLKLERYDRVGNIDSAIELLRKAIGMDKTYAPAYAEIAQAYLLRNTTTPDRQWLNLANSSAQSAVDLNPDLAICHVALGAALFQSGGRAGAETRFRRRRWTNARGKKAL
jgi:serine/threonine protein kinase